MKTQPSKRGRPSLPDSEKRHRVTIRLKPETIRKLQEVSKSRKVSQSRVVEDALGKINLG